MDNVKGFHWLIKLANILLFLLCAFLVMKLSPVWLPVLQLIGKVMIPLLIAGLITYLLHPIIEKLHDFGLPRPVAVLLIYLLFFGGLAYLVIRGTPYLIGQLREMVQEIPYYVQVFQSWLNWFNESIGTLPEGIQNHILEWLQSLEGRVESGVDQVIDLLLGLVNSFIYFIVIPFLVFYFLKDFKLMEKVSWYLTPKKWRKEGRSLIKDIDQSFGNFIRGQILVSLSVGILATIGLWAIGMPYPILLGMFIGATDIIPYFGAFLGAVPALIVAALQSWKMLLLTGGLIFVLQQIEGNILSPVIVGKTLHLHPILIMMALITGVEVAGILGLVLAVPVLAIVKVILLHVRAYFRKD